MKAADNLMLLYLITIGFLSVLLIHLMLARGCSIADMVLQRPSFFIIAQTLEKILLFLLRDFIFSLYPILLLLPYQLNLFTSLEVIVFSITAVSPSGMQLGLVQYFGYAEKTALINYCKRFKIKNRKEYTFAIAYEK